MPKALITGASAGIGLEFCYQLANKNYDLILVSRNESKLNKIAEDIKQKISRNSEILVADLATDQGIQKVCEKINNDMEIEFVVNNAGLGINKKFHEADLKEEDRKSTRLNSSHIPLSRMPSSA